MNGPRYVVKNENMLGYTYLAQPGRMWVLARNIKHTTYWSPLDGAQPYSEDEIRPATKEDFAAFRVSHIGHLYFDPLEPRQ